MALKNKITELKNSIERCNSRLEYRVKRLNEPEDRTFEIIHTDTKKMGKKKLKGFIIHHKADQYTHCRSLRRRRGRKKIRNLFNKIKPHQIWGRECALKSKKPKIFQVK